MRISKRTKKAIEAAVSFVFCLAATFVLLTAAVDAYEYETTGSCRDCILLHKVRGWW